MPLNLQQLRRIAARASSLSDRLFSSDYLPAAPEGGDREAAGARLAAWGASLGRGGDAALRRRLAHDGLDEPRALAALSEPELREGAPLPDWTIFLSEAIGLVGDPAPRAASERFLDPKWPMPFEELFAPFVLAARSRFAALAADVIAVASPAALATLERSLLKRLVGIYAPTMMAQFSYVRASVSESGEAAEAETAAEPSREIYDSFIGSMAAEGGLEGLLAEFPVLARLLSTACLDWAESSAELLQRFSADAAALQQAFPLPSPPRRIEEIKPALSDPHHQGRMVSILTIDGGAKIVYKPKDLGLEVAFGDLLAWLNGSGAPLGLQAPIAVNRGTHGWVEQIEHAPCASAEEADLFYQRAGALLAVIYLLDGTDCHHENFIARGGHLMMIDMETLLTPEVRPERQVEEEFAPLSSANRLLWESVIRSGFLPAWQIGPDGQGFDLSALGGSDAQRQTHASPKWEHVNTDAMALTQERMDLPPQANVPTLGGRRLSSNEYVDSIVGGFERMYGFLVAQRAALGSEAGPLAAMRGLRGRLVFRGTRIYGLTLKKASEPRYMADGADRSISLEVLARAFLVSEEKPRNWPLLALELDAAERGDIPCFFAPVDAEDFLLPGGGSIPRFFLGTSHGRLMERLARLGESDLARQKTIIRGAVSSRVAASAAPEASAGQAPKFEGPPPTRAELLAAAGRIAEEIDRLALRADDGGANWIVLGMASQRSYQLEPMEFDLYEGTTGVALFLAALDRATGDPSRRPLIGAALAPLLKVLDNLEKHWRIVREVPIGGAAGWGGIAYSLVKMSSWLGDPSLLDAAKRAAGMIALEAIAADQHLDVIGGAAGAILGLLAAREAAGEAMMLEQASLCGERLLAARVESPEGPMAWPVFQGRLLAGFSHGAAGIAYALLRLAEALGPEAGAPFRKAAEEGMRYERAIFSSEAGNWPDLRWDRRIGEPPAFMTSWCHGAPGIALGRIGALSALDAPAIREEIEAGVAATLAPGIEGVDHLCCGNLGRADILLEASRRLGRPELRDAALDLAGRAMRRAEREGSFKLFANIKGSAHSPGFFQGTAGIGYALLRLAEPENFPCVLRWE